MLTTQQVEKQGNLEDVAYENFIGRIQQRFMKNIELHGPLFTTNNTDIWELYLSSFSELDRQYHNCSACRSFIKKYGSLAVINNDGIIIPAMWCVDDAECYEKNAVQAMVYSFENSKITGVFLSNDTTWGTPVTGIWRHYAIIPPSDILYRGVVNTPGQAMAEKKEDFKNIIRALQEFNPEVVERALSLLKMNTLYRGEKIIGPVQWLHDLITAISDKKRKQKTNLIWKAVAIAPASFCHPRSSMAGTLLEDLAAGMDFDTAARRFKDKMHPLQYQRPQAAPSAGNIERAEKIVEKLNIKESLRRRFARLDEIQTIWKPIQREQEEKHGGLFAHLKAKDDTRMSASEVPASVITWEKFSKDVLPECESMQYRVRNRDNFVALLTAAVEDAPPILQWDAEESRNPVSLYVYAGGSPAQQWGLTPGTLVDVTAISRRPNEWQPGFDHHGNGIIFILAGAVDSKESGIALFPETLKSEFHEIRSTIEAFSSGGQLEGRESATACGVLMDSGGAFDGVFRCKTKSGITVNYKIDRMD